MADTFNICIAAFMVILCVFVARHLASKDGSSGDLGFSIFWGGWWLMILIIYALFHFTNWVTTAYWAIQCFDMLGAAMLFTASYALFKGQDFKFWSAPVRDIFCASFVLVVLAALGGLLVDSKLPAWRVFAMAPSQVLGCVAFIGFGIAASHRFPDFTVPIYAICGIYSLLQVPGYYAVFIETIAQPTAPPSAPFLKGCLAAGKGAFAVHTLAILGVLNSQAAQKPLLLIKVVLSIISIGLSLAIIYYRVYILVHHAA